MAANTVVPRVIPDNAALFVLHCLSLTERHAKTQLVTASLEEEEWWAVLDSNQLHLCSIRGDDTHIDPQNTVPLSPELVELVTKWGSLPKSLQTAILAILRSHDGGKE